MYVCVCVIDFIVKSLHTFGCLLVPKHTKTKTVSKNKYKKSKIKPKIEVAGGQVDVAPGRSETLCRKLGYLPISAHQSQNDDCFTCGGEEAIDDIFSGSDGVEVNIGKLGACWNSQYCHPACANLKGVKFCEGTN